MKTIALLPSVSLKMDSNTSAYLGIFLPYIFKKIWTTAPAASQFTLRFSFTSLTRICSKAAQNRNLNAKFFPIFLEVLA